MQARPQHSGLFMPDQTRLLYLIGQFPAINHGYLLAEIRHLREFGLDVAVASVSPPDRLPENLSPVEREEAERTYCLKSVPLLAAVFLNGAEFLRHPLRYLRGLIFAIRLAGPEPRQVLYHLAYFAEAVLVGRYMRRHSLTHVYANFSATVALIAAHTFPITMSFAAHGFGELHDPTGTHLAERIQGSLFVRSVSRHARSQLMLACERSAWSKLIYVPLGIDPADFVSANQRVSPSVPRLLCVGRLAPEKGQSLLLEAIADLKGRGRIVHLRLVGDGPDRAFLEQRSAELGIAQYVEFAGWIDHGVMNKAYAETDLFVLPSLVEGIPIVLMEAMAMQLPCVAPCITGIPELISNGNDGMLFSVGDVESLTNTLKTLLESPELCTRLGKQARERVVRDYNLERNTRRFAAVLVGQLSGKSR